MKQTVRTIFKAVAVAMGIAVVVLSTLNTLPPPRACFCSASALPGWVLPASRIESRFQGDFHEYATNLQEYSQHLTAMDGCIGGLRCVPDH